MPCGWCLRPAPLLPPFVRLESNPGRSIGCAGKPIIWTKGLVIGVDYEICELKEAEYPLLEYFLYEAIFVPEGVQPPPKSIISAPELQVYIRNFGTQEHDRALAAKIGGKTVGAVWVRIMDDYGHVDDKTPSFAIALCKEYRGFGIGTGLMREMLGILKGCGYEKASLAVQKANYAVKMYFRAGFEVVGENEEEYIMVKFLQG